MMFHPTAGAGMILRAHGGGGPRLARVGGLRHAAKRGVRAMTLSEAAAHYWTARALG
jgi:hypothetical protein